MCSDTGGNMILVGKTYEQKVPLLHTLLKNQYYTQSVTSHASMDSETGGRIQRHGAFAELIDGALS
jgi:hypothetical protein